MNPATAKAEPVRKDCDAESLPATTCTTAPAPAAVTLLDTDADAEESSSVRPSQLPRLWNCPMQQDPFVHMNPETYYRSRCSSSSSSCTTTSPASPAAADVIYYSTPPPCSSRNHPKLNYQVPSEVSPWVVHEPPSRSPSPFRHRRRPYRRIRDRDPSLPPPPQNHHPTTNCTTKDLFSSTTRSCPSSSSSLSSTLPEQAQAQQALPPSALHHPCPQNEEEEEQEEEDRNERAKIPMSTETPTPTIRRSSSSRSARDRMESVACLVDLDTLELRAIRNHRPLQSNCSSRKESTTTSTSTDGRKLQQEDEEEKKEEATEKMVQMDASNERKDDSTSQYCNNIDPHHSLSNSNSNYPIHHHHHRNQETETEAETETSNDNHYHHLEVFDYGVHVHYDDYNDSDDDYDDENDVSFDSRPLQLTLLAIFTLHILGHLLSSRVLHVSPTTTHTSTDISHHLLMTCCSGVSALMVTLPGALKSPIRRIRWTSVALSISYTIKLLVVLLQQDHHYHLSLQHLESFFPFSSTSPSCSFVESVLWTMLCLLPYIMGTTSICPRVDNINHGEDDESLSPPPHHRQQNQRIRRRIAWALLWIGLAYEFIAEVQQHMLLLEQQQSSPHHSQQIPLNHSHFHFHWELPRRTSLFLYSQHPQAFGNMCLWTGVWAAHVHALIDTTIVITTRTPPSSSKTATSPHRFGYMLQRYFQYPILLVSKYWRVVLVTSALLIHLSIHYGQLAGYIGSASDTLHMNHGYGVDPIYTLYVDTVPLLWGIMPFDLAAQYNNINDTTTTATTNINSYTNTIPTTPFFPAETNHHPLLKPVAQSSLQEHHRQRLAFEQESQQRLLMQQHPEHSSNQELVQLQPLHHNATPPSPASTRTMTDDKASSKRKRNSTTITTNTMKMKKKMKGMGKSMNVVDKSEVSYSKISTDTDQRYEPSSSQVQSTRSIQEEQLVKEGKFQLYHNPRPQRPLMDLVLWYSLLEERQQETFDWLRHPERRVFLNEDPEDRSLQSNSKAGSTMMQRAHELHVEFTAHPASVYPHSSEEDSLPVDTDDAEAYHQTLHPSSQMLPSLSHSSQHFSHQDEHYATSSSSLSSSLSSPSINMPSVEYQDFVTAAECQPKDGSGRPFEPLQNSTSSAAAASVDVVDVISTTQERLLQQEPAESSLGENQMSRMVSESDAYGDCNGDVSGDESHKRHEAIHYEYRAMKKREIEEDDESLDALEASHGRAIKKRVSHRRQPIRLLVNGFSKSFHRFSSIFKDTLRVKRLVDLWWWLDDNDNDDNARDPNATTFETLRVSRLRELWTIDLDFEMKVQGEVFKNPFEFLRVNRLQELWLIDLNAIEEAEARKKNQEFKSTERPWGRRILCKVPYFCNN